MSFTQSTRFAALKRLGVACGLANGLVFSGAAVGCGSSKSSQSTNVEQQTGGTAGSGGTTPATGGSGGQGGSGASGGSGGKGGTGGTGGSGGSSNGGTSAEAGAPEAGTGGTSGDLDLQVGASGVLDPEFDIYSNRYTYCEQSIGDGGGKLWIGRFNDDGSFDDFNAHPGGVPIDDCLFQINGPEWGRDNSGAVVSYVKYDTNRKPTLAYVHEDSPDNWSVHIVPSLPDLPTGLNAVYPSDTPQENARVLFVATDGVEWRDLGGGDVPGPGGGLVTPNQGFVRWATQANSIAFLDPVDSVRQMGVFNTDDGSTTQVSDDSGDKNNPHMWMDETWGMIVAGAVEDRYEVFQLSTLTKVLSIDSPNKGAPMQSPEHFVYHGHSYIYYFVQNDAADGTKNADIYVTSIVPNYKHLKVSGTQVINRFEPEVAFPSSGTPIIYFSADGADGGRNAMWRSAIVDLP